MQLSVSKNKSLILVNTNIKEEYKSKIGAYFIVFGIVGYILTLLFNGILMHFGLQFTILEKIRPILPELFLFFSTVGWIINCGKISFRTIFIIVYYLLTLAFSISQFSFAAFLITFRNFLIPMFFMLIFSDCEGTFSSVILMKKCLLISFGFFSVIGCIMSIYQQAQGWSAMGVYFQGYESWGDTGVVRIVWSSYGTLRCLGTTGESTTFGLYNVVAILIFLFIDKKINIIKFILTFLSAVSIYESGNKTAILIGVFLIFYYIMTLIMHNYEKLKNQMIIIIVVGLGAILLFISDSAGSDSFLYTMNIRYQVWESVFNIENISNLFLPHNVFAFSSFGSSGGTTTIWDNSYLYIAFSFGIFGLIILALSIGIMIKRLWHYDFVKLIGVVFGFSMISTNIFIGRNIAGFLMILLGFIYMNREVINNEKKYISFNP